MTCVQKARCMVLAGRGQKRANGSDCMDRARQHPRLMLALLRWPWRCWMQMCVGPCISSHCSARTSSQACSRLALAPQAVAKAIFTVPALVKCFCNDVALCRFVSSTFLQKSARARLCRFVSHVCLQESKDSEQVRLMSDAFLQGGKDNSCCTSLCLPYSQICCCLLPVSSF